MFGDRLLLWAMAVFFILVGLFTVTNVQVEWGKPLTGFAAIVVGVICVVRAVKG